MESHDRKLNVVVAEDDYLVSMEVVRVAEAAGMSVEGVAANGLECVELVKKFSPDAAIVDIRMPHMDGLEAARKIREEKPTPVILLTAYETSEFLQAARESGVGAYLTKPPDPLSLRRAVEIAIARHDDLMELGKINAELREALGNVKTLNGLLPICSSCKKIRNDQGYWQEVESYIKKHTDAEFSHGICPDCIRRLYPDFVRTVEKDREGE